MPADAHATPALPGRSPVAGKSIVARFDGGALSSDGGLLALREIEERLGIARRLAACIDDPLFKLARGRLTDAAALCSQPTLSRLENTPGRR